MLQDSNKAAGTEKTSKIFNKIRGNQIKRNIFAEIIGLCGRKCPIEYEKLLSWIEIEVGSQREKAKGMLMALSDVGLIKIDEESQIVEVVKNE